MIRSLSMAVLCAVLAAGPVPANPSADLRAEMASARVPGLGYARIAACRVVERRSIGMREAGKAEPVARHMQFQAASISKVVTAVLVLRLAEQGRFALADPVNRHLRDWTLPGGDGVRIDALLAHAAGIGVHGFAGYDRSAPLPTLDDILEGRPPANSPTVRPDAGAPGHMLYSGGGYMILQKLVEDTTGLPFAEAARRELLAPLGMADSRFDMEPAGPQPRALPHGRDGAPLPEGAHRYPESAAAGLWSTPDDLARFAIDLARSYRDGGGRLLSQAVARAMFSPHSEGYGLGIALARSGGTTIGFHGGSNAGFRAVLLIDVDRCEGAVVMTNGDGGGVPARQALARMARVHRWNPLPEAMKP